tara:strand:+ start:171 stop:1043 length:873 start_codon:yes stop_codon:yes gene_type:complete
MNFLELAKYVGPKQSIADVMETFNVSYFVAARARDIFRFRQEQPGKKILVVPDCHVEVGQDLSRFKLLAEFANKHRPDIIVQMGDFNSFVSVSFHAKLVEKANITLAAEIKAGKKALDILEDGLDYTPRKVAVGGNHDNYVQRYLDTNPNMRDLIDDMTFGFKPRGWEHTPFPGFTQVEGIVTTHFVQNKMGRAVAASSAVLLARKLVQLTHESVMVGHSHQYGHAEETSITGRTMHGLVTGCFFENDHSYAGQNNVKLWRGVQLLQNAKNGDFRVEPYTIEDMRANLRA